MKTWKDELVKICGALLVLDERKFSNFENAKDMKGKKTKFFSVVSNGMGNPKKIGDKIYVETNQSANSIRNLIIKLLKAYSLKINEYKMFFRADYTNFNR